MKYPNGIKLIKWNTTEKHFTKDNSYIGYISKVTKRGGDHWLVHPAHSKTSTAIFDNFAQAAVTLFKGA